MERKRYLIALIFEVAFYFLIAFFGFGFDYFKNFDYKNFAMENVMYMAFLGGSALVLVGTLLAVVSPHLRFVALLGTIAQIVGEVYLFFKMPDFFKDFYSQDTFTALFNWSWLPTAIPYIALGIIVLGQLTVVLSLLHVLHTIILPMIWAILSGVAFVYIIVCVAKAYGDLPTAEVWENHILVGLKKTALILLAYPLFHFSLALGSDAYHAEKAYKTPRY